ncbi:MAG: HAMP domain-containing histidine kinase [Bacteroidales bacterium]|nr:HAMP domain-containing histidine kinase [Bacteroidales bacterium]
MNLIYRITFRISVVLLLLFAIWGTAFYFLIIEEINDETDDSLEDYSEYIITRALAGEKLPEKENGTNNTYYITEVTPEYVKNTPAIQFMDKTVYLQSKGETEPGRILKTIFKDEKDHYYELTVMIPTIEKEDLKQTILFWIIILYIVLLIAIITVNAFVLRRSLKPLYVILDWIDTLAINKDTPPLNVDSEISEFEKLSEALLRSAQRNTEMYEQQSLFIGHASHELQTPIAVAQNRLEMLANDSSVTEKQLEEILKIRNSLENISKLNKTLLLLTKIENQQFPDSKEIHINDMLKELSGDFQEAYGYKNIDLVIHEDTILTIKMNEILASVLFNNLLKNAYIHNDKNGQIIITIHDKGVRFVNTAFSGALNPQYIFQRFYQGSKREGAAGLGLSLVKSICKLYDLEIVYSYEDNMHSFEIKIPT